jgi:hypothetical protein
MEGPVKKVALMALVAALLPLLAACDKPGPENTDPREGRVDTGDWTHKHCDGTMLVYTEDSGKGISVIPNSPECQP